MSREDEIEEALRSAVMTMSLVAGILEKGGDEHGVALSLRNEISAGNEALKDSKLIGFDVVIDPTLPEGVMAVKDGDRLLARIVGIAPNAISTHD